MEALEGILCVWHGFGMNVTQNFHLMIKTQTCKGRRSACCHGNNLYVRLTPSMAVYSDESLRLRQVKSSHLMVPSLRVWADWGLLRTSKRKINLDPQLVMSGSHRCWRYVSILTLNGVGEKKKETRACSLTADVLKLLQHCVLIYKLTFERF